MMIYKLNRHTMTAAQFSQLVTMEENCGLEPYSPDMLLDCIENLDTYVCMKGETVAGFITVHPFSRKLGGGLYIVNLNVAGNYRRQGIGRALMVSACARYRDSHAGSMVSLDVTKTNTAALKLYQKLGFVVTDIPSSNGDTDVVMVAALERLIKENVCS